MGIVVTVVTVVVLAGCLDLAVPPRPRWALWLLRERPDAGPDGAQDAPDDVWGRPATPTTVPLGLFTREFVAERLERLTAELRRLETDRTIFARGFRTLVAQDAYRALLDDRSRLARVPTLEIGSSLTFEEDVPVGRRLREEIEI